MITLIGMWEKDWLDNRIELFMWKQLYHAFKVDRLVMVGISKEPRITIDQYETMEKALETCEGELVFMEIKGDVMLDDLAHPENAVYIFGNAYNHNLRFDGLKVRIDTPEMADMFAVNAAAIVLASRL